MIFQERVLFLCRGGGGPTCFLIGSILLIGPHALSPIMQSINPSHCRVVDMDIGIFNNQIPEIRAWFVSGRDVSPCDESYF